jgi:hypothetical protein
MTTLTPLTQPPHELSQKIDLALFPDGLKSTGQHEPLPEFVAPFEKYPAEITGPTVWRAEDYKDSPEKWVHRFTAAEVEELSAAADRFIADGIPLTGITRVCQLIHISKSLANQIGKLPPPQSRRLSTQRPARRLNQRQRLHPVQRAARYRMGQPQVRRGLHGPGHVSRLLCQPEQPRPCAGARQGPRRGCHAD